jgi:hypothetical protein
MTAWLASAAQAAGVEGTVVAADSTTAVANATVILSAPGAGGGARTPLDTAQTDAQGKFSFTGLAAGDNFGVAISATGFRPYTNNNLDLAADTSIATLKAILAVMPPPAAISGTVVGADTVTPVANASVILTRAGTGGGGLRTPVDTLQTDTLGKFSFPALAAADNYGLSVTATGFDPYTNNNIDLAGKDTSLVIRITPTPPPAAISGTVVGADTVTPVANASVILTRAGTGGGGARTPVDTLQTDTLGKFSFPGLAAANNYGLSVTATGFEPYTNNNIDLVGKDTSLLIRITPPPPPAAISGTVVGADTVTPVANATVVLSRPGTGGGARTPIDTLQTDAQGKFSFPGLAAADNYGLSVTATGFQAYANNNIDLEGRDTSLIVRLTPPPAPGAIRGTVFGADSATAVANAMVILNRPGTGGGGARVAVDTMQTDAQGKYDFPGVSALQNYGLVVVAAGFQPYTNNNVDINGGDTATVNVRLLAPGAPGMIAGTVRGPAGANAAPIPNASVILRSPLLLGGLPLDTAQTDTAGRYSFPSVPSMDNYVVSVSVAGFNAATNNNVDVDSADTATVNFTLVSTSLIRLAQGVDMRLTWMNGGLAIRFPALAAPYLLTAYAPNGAIRYLTPVPAQGGLVTLPSGVVRQPGTMLVLSGNGKRTHLRIPVR